MPGNSKYLNAIFFLYPFKKSASAKVKYLRFIAEMQINLNAKKFPCKSLKLYKYLNSGRNCPSQQ